MCKLYKMTCFSHSLNLNSSDYTQSCNVSWCGQAFCVVTLETADTQTHFQMNVYSSQWCQARGRGVAGGSPIRILIPPLNEIEQYTTIDGLIIEPCSKFYIKKTPPPLMSLPPPKMKILQLCHPNNGNIHLCTHGAQSEVGE